MTKEKMMFFKKTDISKIQMNWFMCFITLIFGSKTITYDDVSGLTFTYKILKAFGKIYLIQTKCQKAK